MEDVKYPIELEVITPLSVGAGNDNEWTRGIDYVQKDGKVYVLDIQKAVAKGVDIGNLSNLFLRSDEQGICKLLGNKIPDISRLVFQSPANTINPIKAFLRTQLYDKPIVAGSSLKGSIRSALFNYLRTNEDTNNEVFGDMNKGTDFMRFIRIADIEMPSTELVNSKIFNLRKEGTLWYGGWKHKGTDMDGNSHTDSNYMPIGFNTLYECVVPGKKGYGSISLAGNAFDVMSKNTTTPISYKDKKEALLAEDISHLFMAINEVTREYLKKERDFFQKYPAERSDELIDSIDYLLSLIPPDGSCCLLKMSAGVGFHSITGDWQFEDYDDTGIWKDQRNNGKKKYKSRKTAEYGGLLQLMGFVKLRKLSSEEAVQKELSLQNEHNNVIEGVLAPVRAEEAARQKKAEEEHQRMLAKAEEERRQKEYQELIHQAEQYYNDKLWDKTISVLEEATLLCPDSPDHNNLKDKCIKAKDLEEFRHSEQKAAQQKYSQPLSEVIKGKTSAGNIVGTTVKWLKTEGNTFGESEYMALLHELRQLPSKEKKKLNSKRSELLKAIGEERTGKLINEVNLD